MTINEFYITKHRPLSYSSGMCSTVKDFYDSFIEPRLPPPNVVLRWHALLAKYVFDTPSVLYFIRKYESYRRNGEWNNRRGCIVQFKNLSLVYSSNFLAHDIYLMAYNDFCPEYEDFKGMVETRQLRNTIGTDFERAHSSFPGNNKTLNCYLAHVAAVNQDGYYSSDGSIIFLSKVQKQRLFPIGEESDWNNPEKVYSVDYSLSSDEKAIIQAHTIRLLNPMNYFLTPQTKNSSCCIQGFQKNIGEYSPVIQYVANQFKRRYGDYYNDFLHMAKIQLPIKESASELINLCYNINTTSSTVQKKKAVKGEDIINPDIYCELKVGQLAQRVLGKMLQDGCVSDSEITSMQSADYSKKIFDLQYPLLVRADSPFEKERYYAKPISIKGELYYLCSQWYETNDRFYLLKWIGKHQKNNTEK